MGFTLPDLQKIGFDKSGLSQTAADALYLPLIHLLTETTDAPDGANDFVTIYDNSSSVERKEKINNFAKRKELIVLSASGMWSSTTSGAVGVTQAELSSNKVNIVSMDFLTGATTYAEISIELPLNYDGSTLTAIFKWTATADGVDPKTVIWGIQGRCYGNFNALDAAWGTAQEVTDSIDAGQSNYEFISSATSAITLAGTPAGGKRAQLRIYKKSTSTLATTAKLLEVVLTYGINKYSNE